MTVLSKQPDKKSLEEILEEYSTYSDEDIPEGEYNGAIGPASITNGEYLSYGSKWISPFHPDSD